MLDINFINTNNDFNKVILISNDFQPDYTDQLISAYEDILIKTISSPEVFGKKFGETKVISHLFDDKLYNVLLIGIGNLSELTDYHFEKLGGKIYSTANGTKLNSITIIMPNNTNNIGFDDIDNSLALIANGALLASYRFDKYLTKNLENKIYLKTLNLFTENKSLLKEKFNQYSYITKGVFLARNCISEPANILYPESYSEIITKEFESDDVEVEILGEREMKELGMNALLGVGQGSTKESKLVIMRYMGADSESPNYGLVGKGVTFDTGGISLKPSNNMWEMKSDMSGSAAVFGTIKALVSRKAKVNIIGVIALVENMPSGSAQRPGDIVKSMSGQTIEIMDTDAEGRLILADALWYIQEKFQPEWVIDLATLTGAIVVALGNTYAGCFANDNTLAQQLINSGQKVNEKLWQMPLHKDFNKMMDSEVADMSNLGNVRGAAGSSNAACFLQRFVQNEVKWAHLDIAGMAWKKANSSICPKGAVGFGVRLLNRFISDYYEQK